MAKVFPRIVDILHQISGLDPIFITPRTLILKHLGLDRLDIIELELRISGAFNIDFAVPFGRDMSMQEIIEQVQEKLIP